MEDARDALEAGRAALSRGDWHAARAIFEEALEADASADALEGLARALWGLGEGEAAMDLCERAYVRLAHGGENVRAARLALWLAHEYATTFGNRAAANGWRLRADRLLDGVQSGVELGWLELVRAEGTNDLGERERRAERAVEIGRETHDGELEVSALAQLGLTRVLLGRIDEGTQALDEAMAAATGGEVANLQAVGETCCTMLLAYEEAGDVERLTQWCRVIDQFARRRGAAHMFGFCRTLHAEVLARTGRWEEAERALRVALEELEDSGQRARCVHPATRLADLYLWQGRVEEAARLVAAFRQHPAAVRTIVELHLMRGETDEAAALLRRRLDRIGRTSLLAASLLTLLIKVELAQSQCDAADAAVDDLEALAARSGRPDLATAAELGRARVTLARGDAAGLLGLERAADAYAALDLPLEAARIRMEYARAIAAETPSLAVVEARTALTAFRRIHAARDADEAAALLRRLGERPGGSLGRPGALTRRELEVLRLLTEGLTNVEIAERLFISPRTAEHHVSSIISKLGLKNRAEAAAQAAEILAEPA